MLARRKLRRRAADVDRGSRTRSFLSPFFPDLLVKVVERDRAHGTLVRRCALSTACDGVSYAFSNFSLRHLRLLGAVADESSRRPGPGNLPRRLSARQRRGQAVVQWKRINKRGTRGWHAEDQRLQSPLYGFVIALKPSSGCGRGRMRRAPKWSPAHEEARRRNDLCCCCSCRTFGGRLRLEPSGKCQA